MIGVDFHAVDYRGRVYSEFFALRDPASGPGWFIYGRNREHYGPRGIIHLCGRPDVAPRKHPHYNVRIRRGFHTLREANAIAEQLNRGV